MNYYVEEYHSMQGWVRLTVNGLFEPTYCFMLSLQRNSPQNRYRVKSTNRLS